MWIEPVTLEGRYIRLEPIAARHAAALWAVSSDADNAGEPVEPDRDWVWREDRIHDLLASEDADVLFLSGCAPNMGKFLP